MFRLALSSHIYFLLLETPIVTLCLPAPRGTNKFKEFKVSLKDHLGLYRISSLHGADESQGGRHSCPLLRSYFIGSCHVWCLETSFTYYQPCSLLFVIIRFGILLRLSGCENITGPSRNGPQARTLDYQHPHSPIKPVLLFAWGTCVQLLPLLSQGKSELTPRSQGLFGERG